MHEITNVFEGLDEADPDFRQEWANRLGKALEAVSSLGISGETFEGASVLYKGALALHYTFEALSVLPETRDVVDPVFQLQKAISNARRGTTGPLQLSDPEARRERGNAGHPLTAERLHMVMCAALAVELLIRADPPMKLGIACLTVADIFGKAGVRGARGGRLVHQTVSGWHTRSLDKDSLEHAAIEKELKTLLPLTLDEALAEAREWAKVARASEI